MNLQTHKSKLLGAATNIVRRHLFCLFLFVCLFVYLFLQIEITFCTSLKDTVIGKNIGFLSIPPQKSKSLQWTLCMKPSHGTKTHFWMDNDAVGQENRKKNSHRSSFLSRSHYVVCPSARCFLTRGYARAYHELLQGLRYANESLAHS